MSYQPFPAFADWPVDFDSSVVDQYFQRLQRVKESAVPQDLACALSEAMRSAAVDTGAIEGLYATDRGFTRTVATQAALWERAADERGPKVRRTIEDQIAGYEMVLDATTEHRPITQSWIRQLHEIMCASQETHCVYVEALGAFQDQPLQLGQYKVMPNNPQNRLTGEVHNYAPPADTEAEMSRLIDELNSPQFEAAHPVVQAAYAHFAFVSVHPFADGNGRVSRALASVFLYRNPGVPLVIFAHQREPYLDALEAADSGHPASLVRFIEQRVLGSIGLILQAVTCRDDTAGAIDAVNSILGDGLGDEPQMTAARLRDLCVAHLREAISRLSLTGRVQLVVSSGVGSPHSDLPSGYSLCGTGHDCFTISARVSGEHGLPTRYYDVVANAKTEPEFMVIQFAPLQPTVPSLEVWSWEMGLSEEEDIRQKLTLWADAQVGDFVRMLLSTINGNGRGGLPSSE